MYSRYVKVGVQSDLDTAASSLTSVLGAEVRFSRNDDDVILLEALDDLIPYAAYYGKFSAKGDLTVYAIYNHINPFLHAVMGSKTDVDLNNDEQPDQYKYTLDNPKPLTIEVGTNSGVAFKLIGVLINSLRATFEPKDFVKFECDLIIRNINKVTHNYVEPDNNKPFVVSKTTVSVNDTTYTLKSFELNIERNISDDEFVIGSMYLDKIVAGSANVHGRMTLTDDDYEAFIHALFGDSSSTSPQSEPTTVKLVVESETTDGSKSFKVTIPSVVYTTGELRMRGKEPLEKTVEWRLVKSSDEFKIEVDA